MADANIHAPIVFQCGSCHRILSDSNQLLHGVAELGVLVLDGVLGVRVQDGAPANGISLPLQCSGCEQIVGRVYEQAPKPEFEHLVHTTERPRYALLQEALESYVLGSAAGPASLSPAEAANSKPPPLDDGAGSGLASSGGDGAAVTRFEGGDARLAALEGSEAAARQQVTQLMRVVLALDQRLRLLEEQTAGSGDGGGGGSSEAHERKRRLS